jgi:ATP-dependent RNA helicase RhlE
MNFQKLGLHPDLLRGIHELGFTRPTPIQESAIPPALEGRDVLACAMTGSGKSAAFLLPIVQRLMTKKRGVTRCLILTPTRELAAQIAEHLKELAVHTPVQGASVFGGVGMGPQEHALRSGVDVVVATPGRLLDHMRHAYAKLGGLEVLVLDEADRMLDMGFLPDIKKIVARLPSRRQTLFFSATMPPQIAKLAHEMLVKPASIDIERRSMPAVGITQAVYPVKQHRKTALLIALLRGEGVESVLVFTRTKHRANKLALQMQRNGIRVDRIHGNRSQNQREKALDDFKRGKFQALVATDIAARGIDVAALSHVINYDVPATPEDYIHRVGRTARAELTGDAFTFVAPEEESDLRAIEKKLEKRLPRVTLPAFDYEAAPDKLERRDGHAHGGGRAPHSGGRAPHSGGRSQRGGGARPRGGKPHARPAHRDSAARAARQQPRVVGHAPRRSAPHRPSALPKPVVRVDRPPSAGFGAGVEHGR